MPLHLAAGRLFFLLLLAAAATSLPAAEAASNTSSNCTLLDAEFVRAAFFDVANFTPPLPGRRACRPVRRLHFPSLDLTGPVHWDELGNLSSLLTVDLSNNSLRGGIGAAFWRAPLLRAVDVSRNLLGGALRFDYPGNRLAALNVSGNQFTSIESVAGLAGLENLDASGNVIRTAPEGLRQLTKLLRLDLSGNWMAGRFPDDLPPFDGLVSLNISYNNFSGVVPADAVRRFGHDAFIQAGNASLVIGDIAPAPSPPPRRRKKLKREVTIALIAVGAAVTAAALAFLAACVACGLTRRRKKKRKDKDGKAAAVWEDEEVVVGAVKVAAAAPVVVLERPLMELTLADLAAATSGFGRESQLAETGGRSGAAYRAVLPGDLHVVVRVVEGPVPGVGQDDDEAAAAAGLRELARLRHPNILPLLGYCIAGKQKLLLFEYMEKGDLHRWLHELPVGSMDTEDIGIDTMEAIEDSRKPAGDWPTRYRIILGIARGLAFLHQGWAGSGRPIVHGRLISTNILLGDDMEARISDFLHPSDETPESDVYRFGTLVFELVTGQARWNETSTSWARGVIRNRKGLNLVDDRLRDETAGTEAENEMTECLRVGLLCTAGPPEKRPTMQQVVGLLKDIRPAAHAG
ncbi:putative LRR receptor-like serine/threonine-protein kinase [Dichanthelium oligosanthes]|uniref:Putative LRR receptor-like serine/threonine-protein kinase n=1 Tax=Dichanthelium oligosanthes TaxID=888268 RepID=A0A1E5W838_9POAL|nr:putative LRR receptor-like serine/threonine-protein kinase [Dichanthelium oligosanthes]